MRNTYDTRLEGYRIDALKAAKDLKYGKDVIKAIESAGAIGEIERIMRAARLKESDVSRIQRRQFDGTGSNSMQH